MSPYFDNKSTDGIRKRRQYPEIVRPDNFGEVRQEPSLTNEEENQHEDTVFAVKPPEPYRDEGVILTGPLPFQVQPRGWWRPFLNFVSRRAPTVELRSSRKVLFGVFTGIATFLVLVVLISTVFARASLTVKPRVESSTLDNVTVTLDLSVSGVMGDKRVIPAERLIFTKKASDIFPATGKEIIEDRARGTVKIYNSFSSSPQSLVATTRFLTDSGVLYRLPKGIVVPGAKIEEGKIAPQFIETELVADIAGEGGNLGNEVTLKIPGFRGDPKKYDGFYAVAEKGFVGGFKGEVKVVAREDLRAAEEKITKRVYDETMREIMAGIPSEFKLVEALREIQITNISTPKEKSRHDEFTAEAEARGRTVVFRERELMSLLHLLLIGDDKTREFVEGSEVLNYQVLTVDYEKGRATVSLRGSIKTKAIIPEGELRALAVAKKEGSLIELLKGRPELSSFRISFFPPWISKAPADENKIRIFVEAPEK